MGFFDAINISASGMTAERLRMDVISNNIANVNTTRTIEGGPYKRQVVDFSPRYTSANNPFANILEQKMNTGNGVKVVGVRSDQTPGRLVYNPLHPDANIDGYVTMPNVDVVTEMVDMITASRAYEANVTAINSAKAMAMKALDIGR